MFDAEGEVAGIGVGQEDNVGAPARFGSVVFELTVEALELALNRPCDVVS
jgi:hypothetical protein